MKGATAIGTQADDIASVWRNLGFDQDNIEHLEIITRQKID